MVLGFMRLLKGFIGYCGVSGVTTRGYPSLWRLAIKSSMGISPGGFGSCLTGSSQAEVFPGLSFGLSKPLEISHKELYGD